MEPRKLNLSKVRIRPVKQRLGEASGAMLSRFSVTFFRLTLQYGLFLLTACTSKTASTTNPKAPKEVTTVTKMDIQSEKFLSTVHVPVSIGLADLERQINQQVNGLIYEDNSLTDNDNDQFMTKVWKREPILLSVPNENGPDSLFHFRVPLRIWAKAGVKVLGFMQYQETEFALDLNFVTRFALGTDWRVSTTTTAEGYNWINKPKLKIAGFEIPVTSLVARQIDKNLGTITRKLDEQVRDKIDLKTPVLNAWNVVRQPYLLSEKYRTWLLVVPRRILMKPFEVRNRTIYSTIGLEGYTLTQTGPKPDVKPATSLPDLSLATTVPNDFRIQLLSEVPYTEATRLASEQFVGKSYDFRDGAYQITITDIDLYPNNNNLIIKAGLTGSIKGDIYLRGVPYYDPQTRTISLRDLTYDLDTRNVLYRTASWLLQGSFARMMEKQLTIPVGDQLDEATKALQARLTNNPIVKGVILNGKIDHVTPEQVYLTAQSLLAVVNAGGKVNVEVNGL